MIKPEKINLTEILMHGTSKTRNNTPLKRKSYYLL